MTLKEIREQLHGSQSVKYCYFDSRRYEVVTMDYSSSSYKRDEDDYQIRRLEGKAYGVLCWVDEPQPKEAE